jgi:hypothetical protein
LSPSSEMQISTDRAEIFPLSMFCNLNIVEHN